MKTRVYNHHHVIQHDFDIVEHDQDAELFIFWNDFHFSKQVRNSAKQGKTLLYQHGRYALQDYYINGNQPETHGILTWGESERQKMIDWGYPEWKVLAVGSPMFENDYSSGGKKVMFVAGHWVHDISTLNSNLIESIYERLPKDMTLVVKTMAKTKLARPLPEGVEEFKTDVNDQDTQEIADKLSECQIVFTLMESTFELHARLAGIPVVQIANSLIGRLHGQVDIAGIERPHTKRILESEIQEAILNPSNYTANGWENEILIPSLDVEEIYKFAKGL